jgi:hypothetical protein
VPTGKCPRANLEWQNEPRVYHAGGIITTGSLAGEIATGPIALGSQPLRQIDPFALRATWLLATVPAIDPAEYPSSSIGYGEFAPRGLRRF